jgi:acetylornithine/N-succinyldiaminopimelate aminotransferase
MITPILPTYGRADLEFESGEGPYLVTPTGERYLDFGAGVAVVSLGHAHPHLVEVLTTQAGKLWHTSNLYRIPGQERLAERLVANTFADTVFFTNSGAEAVECAIKMARKYHAENGAPERDELITFEGAFHGRTLATIAAGGQEKYLEGFGRRMPGFVQVPMGDLEALKKTIGPNTAGVLLEPIEGEGGIRPWELTALKSIREICDEAGILLVLDEVQTGIGRTGHLYAHEMAGITPDILASAKGLGGGFPVGACLATEAAAVGMIAGTHGSTFGGNPLSMAVANGVLDIVLEDGFLERVRAKGLKLKQKLAMLADENSDIIETVRGEGLMLGIKCKCPNTDLVAALLDQQLLTVGAGDNVVRLLPPLVVDDTHIEEAVAAISAACAALRAVDKKEERAK